MRTIRLNDDTVHAVNHCGAADGYLQIELVSGDSVLAVAEEFSDPGKTSSITFSYGSDLEAVHIGYIRLIAVRCNPFDQSYSITLMREP